MTYQSEWKKRVYETHEVQVLVRPRTPTQWEYTVRVCRPGSNIRAAGTLVETAALTDHFLSPEEAEAAGFAHGRKLAERLLQPGAA